MCFGYEDRRAPPVTSTVPGSTALAIALVILKVSLTLVPEELREPQTLIVRLAIGVSVEQTAEQ